MENHGELRGSDHEWPESNGDSSTKDGLTRKPDAARTQRERERE